MFALEASMPNLSRFPICSLCNGPIELETGKTDENGDAVHEECYVLKMQAERTKHIGISPMDLTCPRCGAKAGQVCDLIHGEVEIVHVERIKAVNDGWEACYRAAVFEVDDTKLRLKIGEARYAIALRLAQAVDLDVKERRAIDNALEILNILERILERHPPAA
jgi:hypothetical protein